MARTTKIIESIGSSDYYFYDSTSNRFRHLCEIDRIRYLFDVEEYVDIEVSIKSGNDCSGIILATSVNSVSGDKDDPYFYFQVSV